MGKKKLAIVQSNYIPWKGYFDLINSVDEFILYDTAQYTKNDWRNRNKIKTSNGTLWLTIPVKVESIQQRIFETEVAQPKWNLKHFKTIRQFYSKSKFFSEYIEIFEDIYTQIPGGNLSEINQYFIHKLNGILGIETSISRAMDYKLIDGKSERLVHLCKQAGADTYLSGPAARNYLDESLFFKEGIEVVWMDYSGYPEYDQLYPPFEHSVSVIDLIFNEGPGAMNYMLSFK